ncbi:molybdate ABC transporter permease subunit [Methanoculleus sp. FWC-SCC1]|uniref:Molybdate ABC transporter permease subunit n=1 Tax=Methanoculleus frigidifontis TaxID=2584085 RepID=A0ABT8M9W7_9EURY|nr:ABC transporter permease [Methanoculleus sp. FWC-SCC1]MDN7024709.1 molybdate ABC transporter permease subunit [Methanoculleus sp. FWC-SCC1]
MGRLHRRFSGTTIFSATFLAISAALFIFMVAVIAGLVLYPSLPELIASLTSQEIIFAVQLSLITSAVSTALCVVVAVPVAYAMTRFSFPGKSLANVIVNLPLSLPPLVAGVALLIFFGPSLVGTVLRASGIDIVYTVTAIIVAQFFVNVPYMIRVTRSAFEMINPRYEYVARTLGCTEWAAFRQVTLPLASQGLIAGLVITWSKSIGEFGAVLLLAGATVMKTETLPIAVYLNISTGELNEAIAASVILIGIALVSLLVFERYGDGKRIV